jgi:hypothetical protein
MTLPFVFVRVINNGCNKLRNEEAVAVILVAVMPALLEQQPKPGSSQEKPFFNGILPVEHPAKSTSSPV